MELKVTHLSRHREGWGVDLGYDGWFLRFSGDQEAFDDMRDELKTWGRIYARWVPDYPWHDGKDGAWWIDEGLFNDSYADRFDGMEDALKCILEGDLFLQWIATPIRPPRPRREHPRAPISIPLYLVPDYQFLGLPPTKTATAQEVKAAYKSLAKQYHPDAGGSHERFIQLQRAYERVLHKKE